MCVICLVCVRKENIAKWKRERNSALYLVWGWWCGFWAVELVQMWSSWVNCFHYNEIMGNYATVTLLIFISDANYHECFTPHHSLYILGPTLMHGSYFFLCVFVLLYLFEYDSLENVWPHPSSPLCETGFFLWISTFIAPVWNNFASV